MIRKKGLDFEYPIAWWKAKQWSYPWSPSAHGLSTQLTGRGSSILNQMPAGREVWGSRVCPEPGFWISGLWKTRNLGNSGDSRPVDDPSLAHAADPIDHLPHGYSRLSKAGSHSTKKSWSYRSLRFISIDSSLKDASFWVFTRCIPLVTCECCFPSPLNELTKGLHSSPEPESKTKWGAWSIEDPRS